MAETCENCGAAIGASETAHLHEDRVVCEACLHKLDPLPIKKLWLAAMGTWRRLGGMRGMLLYIAVVLLCVITWIQWQNYQQAREATYKDVPVSVWLRRLEDCDYTVRDAAEKAISSLRRVDKRADRAHKKLGDAYTSKIKHLISGIDNTKNVDDLDYEIYRAAENFNVPDDVLELGVVTVLNNVKKYSKRPHENMLLWLFDRYDNKQPGDYSLGDLRLLAIRSIYKNKIAPTTKPSR